MASGQVDSSACEETASVAGEVFQPKCFVQKETKCHLSLSFFIFLVCQSDRCTGDGKTSDGRRDQHESEQLQDKRSLDHLARVAQPAGKPLQDEVPKDVGEVHDLRHHSSWGRSARVHPQSVQTPGSIDIFSTVIVFPQNIDLPETTFERIEALIYLVAEEQKFEEQLKKVCSLFNFSQFIFFYQVGYKPFLACVILFHVKILESDNKDDYSDLEFRLLLDTFKKFMRRDIHTRYKYLTRMASIIYQVTSQ